MRTHCRSARAAGRRDAGRAIVASAGGEDLNIAVGVGDGVANAKDGLTVLDGGVDGQRGQLRTFPAIRLVSSGRRSRQQPR